MVSSNYIKIKLFVLTFVKTKKQLENFSSKNKKIKNAFKFY